MSLSPNILLSNLARDKCISKLKDLPAFIQPDTEPKVKASVLVPLFIQNEEIHILYTLRSSNLKTHSGQVSFPGGKIEDKEEIVDAALRETYEEIGVPPNLVDVWCQMSPVQGRDRSVLITPVVGVIKELILNNLTPNRHEVEEIFSVPMSTFCDTVNHGHLKYEGILLPVYSHGKHKIWGITGIITHFFLQCFLPRDLYKVDFTRKGYSLDELMPSKL